jgi:hypothetical protein
MHQNKLQMKEIFNEKLLENEVLKKKVYDLRAEINELSLNQTLPFSEIKMSVTHPLSLLKDLECDNQKFYMHLLTTSQGILFRNKYVEVGISLKIENHVGKALLYIGNRSNREIESLETSIESDEIKVNINLIIENHPLQPLTQSNRIIVFEFTSWFSKPPNLLLKYDNSVKILKLPITSAAFLHPSTDLDIKARWESLGPYSDISTMPCKPETILEDILKKLIFFPSFKAISIENTYMIHTYEILMSLKIINFDIILEIRTKDIELQRIIKTMVFNQFKCE